MRLKEKRKKKNQFNRLLAAVLLLMLLLAASFYAIFREPVKLNLPKLKFSQQEFVRPNTNSPVQELTDKLLEASLPVDFPLVATEGAIKGRLISGGELWFSATLDPKSQVEALQAIVSRLTIEGKKIKKVDLRYSHPIVVY